MNQFNEQRQHQAWAEGLATAKAAFGERPGQSPTSPIQSDLEAVTRAFERLDTMLGQLRGRLNTVIGPATQVGSDRAAESRDTPRSQLGGALVAHAENLTRLADAVSDMIDCLET